MTTRRREKAERHEDESATAGAEVMSLAYKLLILETNPVENQSRQPQVDRIDDEAAEEESADMNEEMTDTLDDIEK